MKCEGFTHWFIDSLAENGEDEDSSNRWSQITGDGLNVVEELPALSRLNDGDPRDTHADQKQHEHPAHMNTSLSEPIHLSFCSQVQKISTQHRHKHTSPRS